MTTTGSGRIHKDLEYNLETLSIQTLFIIMKILHGRLPTWQGMWLHIYNYLYSYKPVILHKRCCLNSGRGNLSFKYKDS